MTKRKTDPEPESDFLRDLRAVVGSPDEWTINRQQVKAAAALVKVCGSIDRAIDACNDLAGLYDLLELKK